MNSLITKSLEDGDIHLLLSFPTDLLSVHETKMTEWVRNYTQRYGKPPTLKRFMKEFDSFLPAVSTDPLGDVYDQELVRKRNIFAREYLSSIQDELKAGKDPLEYIEQLHKSIRGGQGDVTRYTTFDRTSYYRKPSSFPFGIPQIDEKTGGMSKGDLIYLVGRLGIGKTTVSLWMLTKALLAGKRFLMVSNENRADDVVAKIDSYIGGFNPLKKRTASWNDEDIHRLSCVSHIASNLSGDVFIPNHPVQDTKEIQSLIYTYRPDAVMIDGIYLMRGAPGNSHWEKITHISRELKQIAEGEGVPVIGIHQANRGAIGRHMDIENVAYADALAQDADLLLGINKEDDGSIFVEAIKSRWGGDHWGFYMKFFFDTMTVKVLDARLATED